ncbi:hypothetical protein ACJX0J_025487, partial [Zea mays]
FKVTALSAPSTYFHKQNLNLPTKICLLKIIMPISSRRLEVFGPKNIAESRFYDLSKRTAYYLFIYYINHGSNSPTTTTSHYTNVVWIIGMDFLSVLSLIMFSTTLLDFLLGDFLKEIKKQVSSLLKEYFPIISFFNFFLLIYVRTCLYFILFRFLRKRLLKTIFGYTTVYFI